MSANYEWRLYFEENARSLLEVPWRLGAELTPSESAAIAKSLREFQAGESSEGKHLINYAQAYAARTGDEEYLAALRLFIREEQRHGRDLGRFLTLNHIPLIRTSFTDRVFRRLRNLFGGLEASIAVLITAEILAKVYYVAVRNATNSQILRRVCEQILRDEFKHVQFQGEQLAKLRHGRGRLGSVATAAAQRSLYLAATLLVGLTHRKVIRRGGFSHWGWWRDCWREFNDAFAHGREFIRRLEVDESVTTSQHFAAAPRRGARSPLATARRM